MHQEYHQTGSLTYKKEDSKFLEAFHRVIDDEGLKHANDDLDQEVGQLDPYLNIELGLPRGQDDALKYAQVKRRAVDVEGKPIGRPSTNRYWILANIKWSSWTETRKF
jgi:hypothetical protein